MTNQQTVTLLCSHGVADFVAEQLSQDAAAELIVAWCAYADRQRHMGAGALIDGIRSGHQPPSSPHRPSLHEQTEYGQRIAAWLTEKMPDVCKADQRVIAWERRLNGDELADRLARATSPHPAAVAAVIRLHHQHGKGQLTVREHGPQIRAAVKAANYQAIADYELIIARKRGEAAALNRNASADDVGDTSEMVSVSDPLRTDPEASHRLGEAAWDS